MIEALISDAILEHTSIAAAWRSRYLDEQYAVFDTLALKHEDIARSLQAEWDALQAGLKSAEAMKKVVN